MDGDVGTQGRRPLPSNRQGNEEEGCERGGGIRRTWFVVTVTGITNTRATALGPSSSTCNWIRHPCSPGSTPRTDPLVSGTRTSAGIAVLAPLRGQLGFLSLPPTTPEPRPSRNRLPDFQNRELALCWCRLLQMRRRHTHSNQQFSHIRSHAVSFWLRCNVKHGPTARRDCKFVSFEKSSEDPLALFV